MPSELETQFESRRSQLEAVAENLENDIAEILRDAEIGASTSFRVITVDEFAAIVNEDTRRYVDPLVEMQTQFFGQIGVEDARHVKEVVVQLRDSLSIISQNWRDAEEQAMPLLELVCLIPPHVLPDDWNHQHQMPLSFTLKVIATVRDGRHTDAEMQTIPLTADTAPVRALVMKGGGIKGLAYVAALECLETQYEFNWFIGTSAGAITAILLGAGYNATELKEIMQNKDFKDFFDAAWYQKPINLLFHRGLHRADTFTEWLDELLAEKLKSHARVKLSHLPKRVTVYASQRGTRALKFDSQDNDVDAAYAARCSMSIPWVFTPQFNQGMRAYDGGIQHNYPVDELLREYPSTQFVSLYLGSETYEPVRSKSVLADIISITSESSDPESISRYRDSTVIIDPRPIRTLDFSLSDDEKTLLLLTGRVGALSHLSPDSPECEKAKTDRHKLRSKVESARASARRRRRIVKAIVGLPVIVISGFAIWWYFL